MEFADTKPPASTNQLWDLAKIGLAFYVLGLFTVFIYFIQLQILSVDLLKPAAIVLGIYIWSLLVLLPKGLLLLLKVRKLSDRQHNLLFLFVIAGSITFLVWSLNGWRVLTLVFSFLMTSVIYGYYAKESLLSKKVEFQPSYDRMGVFCTLLALLFSIAIYPRLPQYLGGGEPVTVKVYPEDRQVMLSQFSPEKYDADSCINARLLYEGTDDYYFIDKINEQQTGILAEYRIHKVQKKIIKKLIFRKANWINLK